MAKGERLDAQRNNARRTIRTSGDNYTEGIMERDLENILV
jgi:hypothetical protein